jgi:transposase InsO family protein
MTEAFPWNTAPRYLLRDRDASYGQAFRDRIRAMQVKEVVIAARSPWQNAYVDRIIGSIRRECLDHVIIFDERHLRDVLSSYFHYYHKTRTHLSLDKDSRRPGLYTDPLQARLSRSQRSLDCIIATSAAQRELLRPPNGPPISASRVIPLCPRHKCNAVQNRLRRPRSSPAAPMFHSG